MNYCLCLHGFMNVLREERYELLARKAPRVAEYRRAYLVQATEHI